jgi:hypothetical protein
MHFCTVLAVLFTIRTEERAVQSKRSFADTSFAVSANFAETLPYYAGVLGGAQWCILLHPSTKRTNHTTEQASKLGRFYVCELCDMVLLSRCSHIIKELTNWGF